MTNKSDCDDLSKLKWIDDDANNISERESGDGDSEVDFKEPHQEAEKCKRLSKIPIRQKNNRNEDLKSPDKSSEIMSENAANNKARDATEIQDLNTNSLDDLTDILNDLAAVCGSISGSSSGANSLSPRAPLADEEHILEAPEEFRFHDKAPEMGERANEASADISAIYIINDCIENGGVGEDNDHIVTTVAWATPEVACLEDESKVGADSYGGSGVVSYACAGNAPAAAEPSIEIGVERCAQASRCSRDTTATVSATCNSTPPEQKSEIKVGERDYQDSSDCLRWDFKNGRLVFDVGQTAKIEDGDEIKDILKSRDLNKKRIVEGRSRLKYLEDKLKEAGITDGSKENLKALENNSNDKSSPKSQELTEEEQVVHKIALAEDNEKSCEIKDAESSCVFDVRQVGSFTGCADRDFYLVYDELENSSCDECEESEHLISSARGDGGDMGTDGDRAKQHNPDRENLKSLLKKPGRGKDGRKNRVVFNENKNEFFDADYIILIREECDYDDEDEDGVCTCNEHEMVRLTCCEPNCNCNGYEEYSDQTPQSPKFAPPLEFVDAVTLSPPEGYKDMELGEQQLIALQQMARRGQQRAAVCRDCSATHEDEGDGSQSDNEDNGEPHSDHGDAEAKEEKEKTDQSQQTTPTTPPADIENVNQQQRYILETITMTTVTERRIVREVDEEKQLSSTNPSFNLPPGGSPISGILKGGKLWKQTSLDVNNAKNCDFLQQATDSSATSDEEGSVSRRSVRFIENSAKRDVCDGAADKPEMDVEKPKDALELKHNGNNSVSPESTEMTLTFKLGNHVLISNNSLKPNSAVRQLFPCSKPMMAKGDEDSVHQYLVTAESLRAFEEAKRSKLPQVIQNDETDESIKKAIERNTLRRSLIRYEPRSKKKEQKTDNSLVERIKQLTCDVEDVEDIPPRASPPGEEARKSPEINNIKNHDKSFSPSSSSTASSNSSSSTYKKITDLFAKREKAPDIQNTNEVNKQIGQIGPAPDLGNGGIHTQELIAPHYPVTKSNSSNDARKQFLSTLAPLTACVSGVGAVEEHYYHMSTNTGDRMSVASSVGTEYSLEDIDEGLKNDDEDPKKITPDVLAGTPASESGDELAIFVQQDASRIERIKKKYQPETNNEEDDEHDDYGFNRRPSVRGIKPRFGTTTEILQQIQNQLQPPPTTRNSTHVAWPYYSETSLSLVDNTKTRNPNQNTLPYQYQNLPDELKPRAYAPQYRPTTLFDENIYQNCSSQRCARDVPAYRPNLNQVHPPVMRIGGDCGEIYQTVSARNRNGRPESPPPAEMSRSYHQTMVYIPYNHIESYQPNCMSPNPYVPNEPCYARVPNQNQINKRYVEPMYPNQVRMVAPHPEDHYQKPKQAMRPPYPLQTHVMTSRSESPLPGQFSTARSTQTPAVTLSTCTYYPRYRATIGPAVPQNGSMWHGEGIYATKMNRHSFPAAGGSRYPPPDNISLTDSDSQHSGQIPNGFRQSIETTFSAHKESAPNSPTKQGFIERGVPEGAASVSLQDSGHNTGTMTSPTSPQNQQTNPKPLFYAMNV